MAERSCWHGVGLAIFTAAEAADRVSEYVLGLEQESVAIKEHAYWRGEYDATPAPTPPVPERGACRLDGRKVIPSQMRESAKTRNK